MKLVVDAHYGADYQAEAWLEGESGRGVCRGVASIGARLNYTPINSGEYLLESVHNFPANIRLQMQMGFKGLVFVSAGRPENKVLVHTAYGMNAAQELGHGTVQLDNILFDRLTRAIDLNGTVKLEMEVKEVGRPSVWKKLMRPKGVRRLRDDGRDLYERLFPALEPYHHR